MLVKDFRITADKITADTPLEDLGVDSIGMAELIFNVEDEFGLKLPDVPVQLSTFDDVVRYIDEAIVAQSVPAGSSMVTAEQPPPIQ